MCFFYNFSCNSKLRSHFSARGFFCMHASLFNSISFFAFHVFNYTRIWIRQTHTWLMQFPAYHNFSHKSRNMSDILINFNCFSRPKVHFKLALLLAHFFITESSSVRSTCFDMLEGMIHYLRRMRLHISHRVPQLNSDFHSMAAAAGRSTIFTRRR